MSYLTMSMTTKECMGILSRAFTSDWPSGLAWKVIFGLFKRFAPSDITARHEYL